MAESGNNFQNSGHAWTTLAIGNLCNYELKEQYLGANDAQILISGEELCNFPYVKRQHYLFIC